MTEVAFAATSGDARTAIRLLAASTGPPPGSTRSGSLGRAGRSLGAPSWQSGTQAHEPIVLLRPRRAPERAVHRPRQVDGADHGIGDVGWTRPHRLSGWRGHEEVDAAAHGGGAGRSRDLPLYLWDGPARTLKDICCWEHMEEACEQASGRGRASDALAPGVLRHPPARRAPGLRPAPDRHRLQGDPRRATSRWSAPTGTSCAARAACSRSRTIPGTEGSAALDAQRPHATWRGAVPLDGVDASAQFIPTYRATRVATAVLICEKEGFDELLAGRADPRALRPRADVDEGDLGASRARPRRRASRAAFTLHDFDKNGFVMAAGSRSRSTSASASRTSRSWACKPRSRTTEPRQGVREPDQERRHRARRRSSSPTASASS